MMAGVVILEITGIQPVELPQHRKHTFIQNSAVSVGIELNMIWDQGYHTNPGRTLNSWCMSTIDWLRFLENSLNSLIGLYRPVL